MRFLSSLFSMSIRCLISSAFLARRFCLVRIMVARALSGLRVRMSFSTAILRPSLMFLRIDLTKPAFFSVSGSMTVLRLRHASRTFAEPSAPNTLLRIAAGMLFCENTLLSRRLMPPLSQGFALLIIDRIAARFFHRAKPSRKLKTETSSISSMVSITADRMMTDTARVTLYMMYDATQPSRNQKYFFATREPQPLMSHASMIRGRKIIITDTMNICAMTMNEKMMRITPIGTKVIIAMVVTKKRLKPEPQLYVQVFHRLSSACSTAISLYQFWSIPWSLVRALSSICALVFR